MSKNYIGLDFCDQETKTLHLRF